jgi:hypothetical protein
MGSARPGMDPSRTPKKVEYGDSNLIGMCSENLFDNIHSDPRWLPFLRKIGQAPDQVAKIQFRVTLPK